MCVALSYLTQCYCIIINAYSAMELNRADRVQCQETSFVGITWRCHGLAFDTVLTSYTPLEIISSDADWLR